MTDYISREAALKATCYACSEGLEDDEPCDFKCADYMEIASIPAADVREVKRGKWKDKRLDKFRKYEVVCSECGAKYIGNYDAYDEPYDFNFCPNCGADMREEQT